MATTQQILFIDSSVTDISTILADIASDVEVVRIDNSADGLSENHK